MLETGPQERDSNEQSQEQTSGQPGHKTDAKSRAKPLTTKYSSCDGADTPIHLSPRQRQILALVAQGATDNEIACRLYLSSASVSQYMKRIRARLGACSRAHAVALALRHGLLEINHWQDEGS